MLSKFYNKVDNNFYPITSEVDSKIAPITSKVDVKISQIKKKLNYLQTKVYRTRRKQTTLIQILTIRKLLNSKYSYILSEKQSSLYFLYPNWVLVCISLFSQLFDWQCISVKYGINSDITLLLPYWKSYLLRPVILQVDLLYTEERIDFVILLSKGHFNI